MAQALIFDDDVPKAKTLVFDDSQGPSFIGGMKDAYQNRMGQMQDLANQAVSGQISTPEAVGRGALKSAQLLVNDLPSEIIKAGVRHVPDVIKNGVSDAASAIGSIPAYDMAGNKTNLGDLASSVPQAAGAFQQAYPIASGRIGSALDLVNVVAPFAPIGKGKSVVGALESSAVNAKQGLKNATASALERVPAIDNALGKTVRPTASQLRGVSQANYALAEKAGGKLSPKFTNDFIDNVKSYAGPKDEMASVISGENPISKFTKGLDDFRDQPMTLDRATQIDQALTERLDSQDMTDKNGVLNTYGLQVLQMKNKLRESLQDAADNGLVEGGSEGINAYKTAVKDWAAQSQINDINKIIDRASYMDNPATALKTGFRNIAVNPSRLSKYSPDVQKAIKQAARDGDIANILRTEIGSRLISAAVGATTGAAGGPLGALVGAGVGAASSRVARGAAEKMQMGRVNNVIDSIAASSSIPTKKIPFSEILKLPPAQAEALLKGKR